MCIVLFGVIKRFAKVGAIRGFNLFITFNDRAREKEREGECKSFFFGIVMCNGETTSFINSTCNALLRLNVSFLILPSDLI